MAVKCMFCPDGPATGATLHRINAKGEPGMWACERHLRRTDVIVDPEVREIVDVLTAVNQP